MRVASADAKLVVAAMPVDAVTIFDRDLRFVAVGGVGAGRGGRVAVELLAQRRPLVVGHDREVDPDLVDAGQPAHGLAHPLVDLVAQRAAGDGEGDLDRDPRPLDAHVPDHVELDDGPVQLGVLDGTQRGQHVVTGEGHGRRLRRDLHYADR